MRGSGRGRATALIAGLALVAMCLIGGALTRGGPPWQRLDDAWLDLAGGAAPLAGPVARVALLLAALVGPVGWAVVGVLGLALLVRRRGEAALLVVAAPLVTMLLTEQVKVAMDRPRPESMLVEMVSLAYPSGHTSQTAALAAALVICAPIATRWWAVVAAVVGVGAMAWSRTYLQVHWLSDTVGGAALGVGVALLLGAAVRAGMAKARGSRAGARGVALDEGATPRASGRLPWSAPAHERCRSGRAVRCQS